MLDRRDPVPCIRRYTSIPGCATSASQSSPTWVVPFLIASSRFIRIRPVGAPADAFEAGTGVGDREVGDGREVDAGCPRDLRQVHGAELARRSGRRGSGGLARCASLRLEQVMGSSFDWLTRLGAPSGLAARCGSVYRIRPVSARKSKSHPSGAQGDGASVQRLVAGGRGAVAGSPPAAGGSPLPRPAGRRCARSTGGCGRRCAPPPAARQTAASGATCSAIEPKAVPDMRASEIRTSFTPACASFLGIEQ